MSALRVMLIGGGGFIGTALTRDLCESGDRVHVVTREHTPPFDHPSLSVHTSDQSDSMLMMRLLRDCDVIVHLASGSTPATSAKNPMAECDRNLMPSLRFLEVMQNAPSARLIYLSSGGTVYGGNSADVAPESLAPHPISYYGAGKVAFEAFLSAYAHQLKAPVTIVRPTNVYGPGQPFKPTFGVIRMMLSKALSGEPIEILGDGESTRDFLYIDDLVRACGLMIRNERSSGVNIYNVGYGRSVSVNDLFDLVCEVTGRKLDRVYREARAVDVRHSELDCSRVRSDFGWRPEVDLQEGVRRMWHWLKAQPEV